MGGKQVVWTHSHIVHAKHEMFPIYSLHDSQFPLIIAQSRHDSRLLC